MKHVFCALALVLAACTSPAEEVVIKYQEPEPLALHTVQRGEYIDAIADQYPGVTGMDIRIENERDLRYGYESKCAGISRERRQTRRGLFCNERYAHPWAHTLVPGDILRIPSISVPERIAAAVNEEVSAGDRVSIVIDDTGSMSDEHDREVVGRFYSAAIQAQGAQLDSIWLYRDDEFIQFSGRDVNDVRFETDGEEERTQQAITMAARSNPDVIVLITDEPGDDWDLGRLPSDFPRVIANGLAPECERTLDRLASQTKGRYVPQYE